MSSTPEVGNKPATPAAAPKETKAQKSERLKLEKNPWEAWDEVRRYAQMGRESVLPEWTGLYFKWWGIYTQGDGLGVTGGSGGEGKANEYFMIRIGLPNGVLTAHQLRVISGLTEKYARGIGDITTRQNIQLHWISISGLVAVVDALTEIGLSPKGACGDVVRNVTGCPLAGIDENELVDASPIAFEIAARLKGNHDFYNLPRKFKICATGCPTWCCYPEINDVALTAVAREVDGRREVGYSLRVGGGLSNEPHLAVKLNAFVRPEQAVDVAQAIAEIFREQTGLRESRTRARLKYLFMKEGWTPERFLAAIEEKLRCKFEPAAEEKIPDDVLRDHVGVHKQKQPGLNYVGASVLRGRLTADQMRALADLADEYGNGQLRTTIMQNIIIVNVPAAKTQALVEAIQKIGLQVEGSMFWRGAIACTGTEFCKLAISETKGFAKWLVEEMEERMPGFDQQVKMHITGCTNSCGQHWIADIGLEGKKIKHDGVMTDAFYFCVGGSVGAHAGTARPIGYRAPAAQVPEAIERLLRGYLKTRTEGEDLRAYFARTPDAELLAQLNGGATAPVARDVPPGAPPSGVAG